MPKLILKISLIFFLHFFLALPLCAEQSTFETVVPQKNLSFPRCNNCHIKETNDITEAGFAHGSQLSCGDCHSGHRPKSFENIPNCSRCHTGSPHYQLEQCLICHRNPHRPLEITLPKKAHTECMSCHKTQGDDLAKHKSYHSNLVCTDCHQHHGQLPACLSCHRGHNAEMIESVCQNCHQPHKPLDISYADNTPSSDCGGCHTQAFKQLTTSTKNHNQITCTGCHRQKHKRIPECSDCHGKLHADQILERFPNCGDCHGTAHDLH